MLKKLGIMLLVAGSLNGVHARPLSPQAGWQFTLSLNAGMVSSTSQFNTDDDNAVTEDLNNSGQSTSSAIAYPFARIQYTFEGQNTQIYLGNSRDQISTARFQYELGFIHQFQDKSKLTVAAFPRLSLLNDTWADPFLENEERQETEENTAGGRIALERILGGSISLKYALATSDVDDEQSGHHRLDDAADIALLQRDSFYQRVEIETMFPIDKGLFIKPNLQYTLRNAEGDANSYDEYAAQLSLLLFRTQYSWITTFKAGSRRFSVENPIFNLKQDTKLASLFSVFSYQKPFNLDNWSWTLIAGYNREASKITFYDRSGVILSTGIVYTF